MTLNDWEVKKNIYLPDEKYRIFFQALWLWQAELFKVYLSYAFLGYRKKLIQLLACDSFN